MWTTDSLRHAGRNVKWNSHSGKHLAGSWETKYATAMQPSICTLGQLPQRNENSCSWNSVLMLTKTWMWVSIAVLSSIAKNWKQPRYPPVTEGWMVHPSHGLLLSNKNEQTINTSNNLHNLQRIMLCEDQSQNAVYLILPFTSHSWSEKTIQGWAKVGIPLWVCKTVYPCIISY